MATNPHPHERRAARHAALRRAKARLDSLDLYPEPVRIGRVRILSAPWLFRVPLLRRFDGIALVRTILLRRPPEEPGGASDDLVTHELVHVWQGQHRRLRLILSFVRFGYRRNPFEREARKAVAATRDVIPPDLPRV